jgi:predicted NBD/HSP70 family sugar kinase
MALSGDAATCELFAAAGTHLGRALAMAANLFNPEKIIIGGGISLAGDIFLDPVRREFAAHTMDVIRASTAIELSTLGTDAALYGAVSLALNRFVFAPELINLRTAEGVRDGG